MKYTKARKHWRTIFGTEGREQYIYIECRDSAFGGTPCNFILRDCIIEKLHFPTLNLYCREDEFCLSGVTFNEEHQIMAETFLRLNGVNLEIW